MDNITKPSPKRARPRKAKSFWWNTKYTNPWKAQFGSAEWAAPQVRIVPKPRKRKAA